MTEFWVYSSIQGGPVSNEPNKRFGKFWDESVIDKADQDHHRVQILLKKNVVHNMMLMWSQLDAQLRMNL